MTEVSQNILSQLTSLELYFKQGLEKVLQIRRDLEGFNPPAPSGDEEEKIIEISNNRASRILNNADK